MPYKKRNDGKYCVYKHTCPNNKVYIGITSQTPQARWNSGYGYISNKHFFYAIKKYGWNNIKHEIICDNLSEEDAYTLEKQYIDECKSMDRKYGYNNSIGGEKSALGFKHTEEFKKSLSLRTKELNIGRFVGEKSARAKRVCQFDKKGNLIATYGASKEAERETGISYSIIIHCCKGDNKTAGGYIWTYESEKHKISELINNLKTSHSSKHVEKMRESLRGERAKKDCRTKKIKGINLVTGECILFDSCYDAKASGFIPSDINRCCKGIHKSHKGYIWKYA